METRLTKQLSDYVIDRSYQEVISNKLKQRDFKGVYQILDSCPAACASMTREQNQIAIRSYTGHVQWRDQYNKLMDEFMRQGVGTEEKGSNLRRRLSI